MFKRIFKKKQKKEETVERKIEIQEQKQERQTVTKKTKKISEEMLIYFFDKHIKEEKTEKSFEEILKDVDTDEFLSKDEEFKAILNEVARVERKEKVEKYFVFEKLNNYHVSIIRNERV